MAVAGRRWCAPEPNRELEVVLTAFGFGAGASAPLNEYDRAVFVPSGSMALQGLPALFDLLLSVCGHNILQVAVVIVVRIWLE